MVNRSTTCTRERSLCWKKKSVVIIVDIWLKVGFNERLDGSKTTGVQGEERCLKRNASDPLSGLTWPTAATTADKCLVPTSHISSSSSSLLLSVPQGLLLLRHKFISFSGSTFSLRGELLLLLLLLLPPPPLLTLLSHSHSPLLLLIHVELLEGRAAAHGAVRVSVAVVPVFNVFVCVQDVPQRQRGRQRRSGGGSQGRLSAVPGHAPAHWAHVAVGVGTCRSTDQTLGVFFLFYYLEN